MEPSPPPWAVPKAGMGRAVGPENSGRLAFPARDRRVWGQCQDVPSRFLLLGFQNCYTARILLSPATIQRRKPKQLSVLSFQGVSSRVAT